MRDVKLIKARKEIYGAVKNGKGNWGAYASLEDIIEATNEPLLNQDIFVSQHGCCDEGIQYLVTQATHSSGQWIRSYTKIELEKPGNPQKALASQTYTRRAGMEALFNIPRVDDDGEHGNQTKQKKLEEKLVEDFSKEVGVKINEDQQREFIAHVTASGMDFKKALELLKAHGYTKSADIPVDKLEALKDEVTFLSKEVAHA